MHEGGCLLHAVLEDEGLLGVEEGGVVTGGEGEFAADFGGGGDDLEHELLLVHDKDFRSISCY